MTPTAASSDPARRSTYERIYRVVKRIPRGRVATYGQVAREAGLPGQARLVGYALSALQQSSVPWQRVLNAQGKISGRSDPAFEDLQRSLLEAEGVEFGPGGRVSLPQYGWKRSTRA